LCFFGRSGRSSLFFTIHFEIGFHTIYIL
jgi:hypothetical protein